MISSSWDRTGRLQAAASILAVIAVAACVLILSVGMSLPEAWWPRTGHAFAASSPSAHEDPCGLIVGPAKAYCKPGTTNSASADHHADATGAAWRLVPAGAGLAALAMWRRRGAAGQRRR
ncbi:hypothetical protein FBY35_0018 [Streptomyces sp. SLBN-118]|uniref:hypothetical protein n=1 Tax=Streptomyces sp. SLBN-118 TaxID=2768454 RepID=UPI00114F5259|nr:hypothetical protein [Streptomyces sp. SLBN-118]TQK49756.1 hypothetical protein FBY35_0018 [Streptomyces sp. SLBN-118]